MYTELPGLSPAELWNPDPRSLPDWRIEVREYLGRRHARIRLAQELARRGSRYTPHLPGPDGAGEGARILLDEECRRLTDARLYFADEDTSALSAAVAATPPGEAVTAERPPSPSGLMVFASPLGTYRLDVTRLRDIRPGAGAPVVVRVPIVAAAWSRWSPLDRRREHGPLTWTHRTEQGEQRRLPPGEYLWLTFYSTQCLGFENLPADTRIGADHRTGRPITAGDQVELARAQAPVLNRVDAMALPLGARLAAAQPSSAHHWSQVVYTAWQLMQHDGTRGWTETQPLRRAAPDRGRDRCAGLRPQRQTVHLVRLQAGHRSTPEAAARDRAEADPATPTRYTHRWPVPPYRRPNACWNTAIHTDDPATRPCKHAEQIVKGSIRGPAHLPLQHRGGPVHLWALPKQHPNTP